MSKEKREKGRRIERYVDTGEQGSLGMIVVRVTIIRQLSLRSPSDGRLLAVTIETMTVPLEKTIIQVRGSGAFVKCTREFISLLSKYVWKRERSKRNKTNGI